MIRTSTLGTPTQCDARRPVSINPDFSRFPTGNVRRRGRDRWQARVYVGGRAGGSVHLGMYGSETAAAQVARRVLKTLLITLLKSDNCDCRSLTPLDVWRATQILVSNGFDVDSQLASLLPRCVKRDGPGKFGYSINGGNGVEAGGFSTPEEAHRAALAARRERAKAERAARCAEMAMSPA